MSDIEKFKPRTFTIEGVYEKQSITRMHVIEFMDKVRSDKVSIDITISPHEDSRGSSQNRLMWLWNGQIGQAMGVSPDYAHGLCKLDVGLPFMLSEDLLHKRAMFVKEVLGYVIKRDHKIATAYDMIRTKDLSTRQFAAYLKSVDMHFAAEGITLVSPDDLRNQALYNLREAKVA